MQPENGVPREELGNELRRDIFSELMETGDRMTPSEIAGEVDSTRQQIQYHLDKLVRMGLVVSSGEGDYRVQPLFLDGDYEQAVLTALSSLIPEAEERIVVDDGLEDDAEQTVLLNCLRLSVAMHVQ
jgi:DNA-binding transcriptional ArsR family regulator